VKFTHEREFCTRNKPVFGVHFFQVVDLKDFFPTPEVGTDDAKG